MFKRYIVFLFVGLTNLISHAQSPDYIQWRPENPVEYTSINTIKVGEQNKQWVGGVVELADTIRRRVVDRQGMLGELNSNGNLIRSIGIGTANIQNLYISQVHPLPGGRCIVLGTYSYWQRAGICFRAVAQAFVLKLNADLSPVDGIEFPIKAEQPCVQDSNYLPVSGGGLIYSTLENNILQLAVVSGEYRLENGFDIQYTRLQMLQLDTMLTAIQSKSYIGRNIAGLNDKPAALARVRNGWALATNVPRTNSTTDLLLFDDNLRLRSAFAFSGDLSIEWLRTTAFGDLLIASNTYNGANKETIRLTCVNASFNTVSPIWNRTFFLDICERTARFSYLAGLSVGSQDEAVIFITDERYEFSPALFEYVMQRSYIMQPFSISTGVLAQAVRFLRPTDKSNGFVFLQTPRLVLGDFKPDSLLMAYRYQPAPGGNPYIVEESYLLPTNIANPDNCSQFEVNQPSATPPPSFSEVENIFIPDSNTPIKPFVFYTKPLPIIEKAVCIPKSTPVSRFKLEGTADTAIICRGSLFSLRDGSTNFPDEWQWQLPNDALDFSEADTCDGSILNLRFNLAGTFTILQRVENPLGMDSSRLVVRVVNPSLPPNLGSDISFCPGDSVVLTQTLPDGATGIWSNAAGTAIAIGETVVLRAPDTYIFTLNTGCGPLKDTIDVKNLPAPNADFIVTGKCLGDMLVVTPASMVSPGTSIATQVITINDIAGNQKLIDTSGNYDIQLIATSNNGCSDTALRTIAVAKPPDVMVNLPEQICTGDTIQLTISNASTDYVYTWTLNGTDTLSGDRIMLNTSLPGPIAIELFSTDSNQCKTIQPPIEVQVLPAVKLNLQSGAACIGQPVLLSPNVQATGNVTRHVWEIEAIGLRQEGNGTPASIAPVFERNGNFKVNLYAYVEGGCADTAQLDIRIEEIRWSLSPKDTTVNANQTVVFRAAPQSPFTALVYRWLPSVVFAQVQGNNATTEPLQQNTTIIAIATTAQGCSDTLIAIVKVKQQLIIPNAFSPNGDGINDVWRIANANEYPSLRVQIFDRYGKLVFNKIGYSQPWDGTIRGRTVPSGTYYYIITTDDGNSPIKGSVTLLR